MVRRPSRSAKADIGTIVDSYIDCRADEGLSPTTIQRYRGISKNNLGSIRNERLDTLDDQRLEQFHRVLRSSGLSPTTIFHVHTLLSAAVRWVTRARGYPFGVRAPSRAKPHIRALSLADATKFIQHASASERGNAVLFSLATGMRRGEIAGLRNDAIDLDRGVVIVRESRYEIVNERAQKRTKSERVREVALSAFARDILEREALRQESWKTKAGAMWTRSGHVFTNELGAALSPYGLSAAFRLIAAKAGLAGYTLHGLRHTFATWLLSSGADITTVSSILGHSSASTTLNVYSHVVVGKQHEAVRIVDRLLDAKL